MKANHPLFSAHRFKLGMFCAKAGYAGAAFGLTNYLEDLPHIRDEVLPRLEAKRLREPAESLVSA